MSDELAHPERLLLALDKALVHEIRLIIYGRSAIWLGFDNPPAESAATQDVDAIIPTSQVNLLADDFSFWDARDAVNEQFKSEGLYITHLFPESDVFLRENWLDNLVPITRIKLAQIQLFRPSTIDLILTKMMRGDDEQDMADAAFMIRHDQIPEEHLLTAFSLMKPIQLVEFQELFEKAKPIVLSSARQVRPSSPVF